MVHVIYSVLFLNPTLYKRILLASNCKLSHLNCQCNKIEAVMRCLSVLVIMVILICCAFSQEMHSNPLYLPVSKIVNSDGQNICPTSEQRETVYSELLSEVDTVLDQYLNDGRPCNGPGWRRIAFLNMTDPSEQCPEVLLETQYSKRTCGRYGHEPQCWSITYTNTNATQYTQVCGRIRAYQWGQNTAFTPYFLNTRGITLENIYMDGISITHGSVGARQHIWSFAIGYIDGPTDQSCPCSPNSQNTFPPPFIRNDYFCESGATYDTRPGTGASPNPFYGDDVLWDGKDCHGEPDDESTCCTFNTPPWFLKALPSPTSDDIELRLCCSSFASGNDIAVELVEIFVE